MYVGRRCEMQRLWLTSCTCLGVMIARLHLKRHDWPGPSGFREYVRKHNDGIGDGKDKKRALSHGRQLFEDSGYLLLS